MTATVDSDVLLYQRIRRRRRALVRLLIVLTLTLGTTYVV